MLAVWAVVLALAGAPAHTPLGCYPHLTGGDSGQTTMTVANGNRYATGVKLEQWVCVGLEFAAGDRSKRDELQQHSTIGMKIVFGQAMLVALHEATHVAHPNWSECQVETSAWRHVPGLLKQFMPRGWTDALAAARARHDAMPASYRYC